MSKKSEHKKSIEVQLVKLLRQLTKDTNHPFIESRHMFKLIGADYSNTYDYRHVFNIFRDWRKQAEFFYDTMKKQGAVNGFNYYDSFEDFLVDFNKIGCFYFCSTVQIDKDDKSIHGMYQPNAPQKQQIDASMNLATVSCLKNKLRQMQVFGQKLPSGLEPDMALMAIGTYTKTYLLPSEQ